MKSNKYIHIYDSLKKDIISGLYPYGSKLPSKRVCADTFHVSVISVEHAYSLLMEEGYMESKQRSGYIVTYKASDSFSSPEKGDSDTAILITSPASEDSPLHAEPNVFPYSVYCRAVRKVLNDTPSLLSMRSPSFGMYTLRASLAGYLKRSRHMDVLPEQILIGSGAESLYPLLIQILGRSITYGIETPSYHQIENVYRANAVSLTTLPLTHDGIVSKALHETAAQALHITPYRSYPTGISASASKKREYLNWSHTSNHFLIEDDCESEFSPLRKPEDTLYSMDTLGCVFYINTFTRTLSPSIRMGYMVIPKKMLEKANNQIGFYSCPVPILDQLVVSQLIEQGDFERHLNRIRRRLRS